MGVPVVTALRARGPGRVAVELDGAPWRVVPLEAVYGAGLAVGGTLDRPTARRSGASCGGSAPRPSRCGRCGRATTRRRRSSSGSPRGEPPSTVRRDTVEAAQRAGLVDDRRFAFQRAEQLASRGSGDLLIGDDLERQGVPPELVRLAIAALEPEAARADTIVAARGTSPKTARYLASRGFSEAALETIVANLASDSVRIGKLHPTFHLHRAHSENRLSDELLQLEPTDLRQLRRSAEGTPTEIATQHDRFLPGGRRAGGVWM